MTEHSTTDYEIGVPVPLQGVDLFFRGQFCVAKYSPLSRSTDVIETALSGLRASPVPRYIHENIYELTSKNTPPSIQNQW